MADIGRDRRWTVTGSKVLLIRFKGAVKEVAGKVSGDTKTEAEGKTEKIAGKVQNAVGGLKDAVRGK